MPMFTFTPLFVPRGEKKVFFARGWGTIFNLMEPSKITTLANYLGPAMNYFSFHLLLNIVLLKEFGAECSVCTKFDQR